MNISSKEALIECILELVHVVSLHNWFGELHALSTWAGAWLRENGLRPAEIMELVCSPRAVLLAGVNSVNSTSFYSQTSFTGLGRAQ